MTKCQLKRGRDQHRTLASLAFPAEPGYQHPDHKPPRSGHLFSTDPMADQFDAFQKEVEEDLQRERMQRLWKDYGTFMIAGCVAIVLGVAGYKFVEARRITAAETASRAFSDSIKALTAKKDAATKDAVDTKPLEALTANTSSYGMLAKLRLAAAHAAAGETAKAVTTYDELAKQAGIDRQIAEYARLQSAMLTIDTASWTETQNRVNDLAVDASPWRHAAREILGMAAYKAGMADEAKSQFGKLVGDPTTPRSISERGGIILAEIAQSELAKTVPALPAATSGDKPAEAKPETKPVEAKPAATTPAGNEPPAKKKK